MKKKTFFVLFIIIFLLAIISRIYLIEKVPVNDNTQIDSDMGVPTSDEDYERLFDLDSYKKDDHGHLYYTLYLFENHRLCDDTMGQTYHPPVHYIITSTFLSIINLFQLSKYRLVEGIQYVGFIYYIFSVFLIFKLFKELETKDITKLIVFVVYSFFPKFLMMCTSISNDYLAFCFMLWVLIYVFRINKEFTYKNVLILAVLFGLGFLVKYNVLVMIIPITYVFIKKIYDNRKDFNGFSNTIVKYFLLGIIAMSIGSSYILRCLLLFKEYNIAIPYEHLYIGNASFIEKWGIPFKDLIILNNYNSKNLWYNLMFSSLIFNEKFNAYNVIIGTLNIILFILAIMYIIKAFVKKEWNENLIILFITFISFFISYVIYNIRMPYLCTMESRYILIDIFIWIYFGCSFLEKKNKNL